MRWLLPTDAPQPQAGRVYDETQAAWWNDPRTDVDGDSVPDPDDPATAGCLLALLGRPVEVRLYRDAGVTRYPRVGCLLSEGRSRHASTLGRACIATAAVLGSWPGGSDTPSGQRAP